MSGPIATTAGRSRVELCAEHGVGNGGGGGTHQSGSESVVLMSWENLCEYVCVVVAGEDVVNTDE